MYNAGYPTNTFTWQDNSGASSAVLYSAATDGLNVPFGFIMSERGTPGAIYFGGAKELYPVLGATTFSSSSAYYNPATQFIDTAMAGQGVEVMRLVDPAATTATLALFVSVTPVAAMIQYQVGSNGARLTDSNGNYIPRTQTVGGVTSNITAPGVRIKWSVRALTGSETISTLTMTQSVSGGVTTSTYPVMAFKVSSPGAYGNRQGFSLYSTGTSDSTLATALNSVLYRFVPMELPTTVSTTASTIQDIYGSNYSDVSFKNVAIYEETATNYAFNYVLGTDYVNTTTGDSLLPYDTFVYGANIGTVGQACLAVSPELGAIDPYLIDLIAGTDQNGNLYNHIDIDPASSTVVNSSVINYAAGGSDGTVSFAMLQTLIRQWIASGNYGEFTNLQQHPMTHFYDPGFTMATKLSLFTMLDLRDNFKIDVATQDVSAAINTQAQDISAGQSLAMQAQMHPESVITGVGCCRVGVYAHASTLISGDPYGGVVPFNLNRLIQRRNLDGGTYIKGSSGGLPNSQVTIFRKPNWIADAESTRALAWADCINVVMHADRVTIFYPSLRTVYPNDTSLLSDDEISDRIIYMFKICRAVWAKYAGVRQAPAKLYPLIQRDINNECALAFASDNINVAATVFQTAEDANLGYSISVNLNVTANMPMRQMNFNVIVARATS